MVGMAQLGAAQGNAQAEAAMGALYENGQGVPQSYDDALKWYRLAAEQGFAQAEAALGG